MLCILYVMYIICYVYYVMYIICCVYYMLCILYVVYIICYVYCMLCILYLMYICYVYYMLCILHNATFARLQTCNQPTNQPRMQLITFPNNISQSALLFGQIFSCCNCNVSFYALNFPSVSDTSKELCIVCT